MTSFEHFTNFGRNKLSNCNFGDANVFSYYYFIYIFYPVFISCVVVWWAIFVLELRSLGWPTKLGGRTYSKADLFSFSLTAVFLITHLTVFYVVLSRSTNHKPLTSSSVVIVWYAIRKFVSPARRFWAYIHLL
jgi:hypothetical protein